MKIKKNRASRLFDAINAAFLIVVTVMCLYPFLFVVFASFSDPNGLAKHSGVLLGPVGFSLESYQQVLSNNNIWRGYGNTICYVFVGVGINMIMTTMSAYALSRRNFKTRNILMLMVVFAMIFKGGLIPNYILIRQLGLMDTIWALTLPVAIGPMNLIIMRTAFEGIPDSLIESAKIDGASELKTYLRIAIPLSIPTILTLVLYYAVNHWNSWFSASIYIRSRDKLPLQMFLREILIQSRTGDTSGDISENLAYLTVTYKYSTIVVSIVPILTLYPFIQKYFVKGAMIGAVKG